ncbi:hypothetical protein ACFYNM_39905 [Streptomyces spororaveus]
MARRKKSVKGRHEQRLNVLQELDGLAKLVLTIVRVWLHFHM